MSVARQPSWDEYLFTTLAGEPTATQWSGISPVTTEPAPTATLRPMRLPGSTTTPVPSQLPDPMCTLDSIGHCAPMGRSGSLYTWFWSVM